MFIVNRLLAKKIQYVTRVRRHVSLVEQKLLTLLDHMRSPQFLMGFV